MVYRGQVKDGVVVLQGAESPPEGATVSVRVLKSASRGVAKSRGCVPTHYQLFKNVIGIVKDMPPDFSVNHDHYLYEAAKRK
jgi:hypothetical protein